MNEKSFLKNVGNLTGPIPRGFIWGLMLLKNLPKPPIQVGIFTPKSKWKNRQYLQRSK